MAPPTDSQHGEIVGYSLTYQALTGEDQKRHQVSGIGPDITSYILEDLEKWTEYLVWVRAHTDVGPGPESSAAKVRTKEDGMLMVSWETFKLTVQFFCIHFLLLQFSLTNTHQSVHKRSV